LVVSLSPVAIGMLVPRAHESHLLGHFGRHGLLEPQRIEDLELPWQGGSRPMW